MRRSALIVVVWLCAGLMLAQTNRGGITGTVFDQSHAVVPKAEVSIQNLSTNQVIKTTASEHGAYSVLSLDPVTYSVTVEKEGFKKALVERVKVDTAVIATVDVTLEMGRTTAEVLVVADVAQVNTESGTTSATINQRQITDAPLVNRSVLDLAMTLPNVMGDAGSENPGLSADATVPGFNLSVNGGRPGSTNILADGVNNTGVSLGRAMVSFSPDTVQEFTVQTSVYSAEYGRTGGGIINATTKSGGNTLSGSGSWYNRNPAYAAAPWTMASQNRPASSLKYNNVSATVGGPVYIPKLYDGRNRTFFFTAFEPFYRRDRLPQDTLLPTPAMRQGDFSGMVNTSSGWVPADIAKQYGLATSNDPTIYQNYSVTGNQFKLLPTPASGTTYLPFPNNTIPTSLLDSSALKALQYIAPAGDFYLNSAGGVSNLYNPRMLRQDEKRFLIKIDQILSPKNRLSGRYTTTPIIKIQGTPTSSTSDGAEYSYAKQAMLSDTHTFSARLVNDLRLNVTRGNFSSTKSPEWDPFTGKNLNAMLGLPNITPGGVPALPYIGGQASTEGVTHEDRFGLTDIVYYYRGAMSFTFGVDLSHSRENVKALYAASGGNYDFRANQTSANGASTTSGHQFASFLLGVPNGVTLRNTLIPYYYRWNAGAAFIQNDWKVRPNLTLNLGLRYSLELPRTEKYDHQAVFLPELAKSYPLATPMTLATGETVSSALVPPFAFCGKGGRSRYLYPADYLAFEPRFGFAWSPSLVGQRFVVRGGYGLSHVPPTGNARIPTPDFGVTQALSSTSGGVDPNYVMRLGSNPPLLVPQTPDQALNVTPDGINYLGSVNYQGVGFAVSNNVQTPYSQNWNLTVTWSVRDTVIETAYVGNRGAHLFMPRENINPKSLNLLTTMASLNLNTTAVVNDPLGRLGTNGRVFSVQTGSLGSPYLGFTALYQMFDASANSIRHATYVSVSRRMARGLTFTSNYTFGKSIDDASDSGVDKFVLRTGRVDGQVAFGADRKNDRSVSLFDMKHVVNATFLYDLPLGRGRRWMTQAWKPLEFLTGGWSMSGVFRLLSGNPAMYTLVDSNLLGDTALTHTIRPDIVPGAPLVNPLWDRNCPVGETCQPYINPQAFMRPALGQYGTAPRTLDSVRGPWQQFFDASVQKNFNIGNSEKRRIQFRVDGLNAFNHPNFRVYPNVGGGTDFMGAPTQTPVTTAEYNAWATANGKPLASTADGTALMAQAVAVVTSNRNTAGVLPLDFFSVPLPNSFWGAAATSYDITTTQGYKYYRLRQAFSSGGGSNGGKLAGPASGSSRYIQFAIRIFF